MTVEELKPILVEFRRVMAKMKIKQQFCNSHNFKVEAAQVAEKWKMLDEILSGLSNVIENGMGPENFTLRFIEF